jgi:hypothetical protein
LAEIDIDIEPTKAKIKLIKDTIPERIMFRSRVKWHEEGEKNNAYFLGLMNSKYTKLDLHKVTDEAGTATEKESIMEKVEGFYPKLYKKRNLSNNYGQFLDNVPKIFVQFLIKPLNFFHN